MSESLERVDRSARGRRSRPLLAVILRIAPAIFSCHTGNAWSAGQTLPPSTNQASSSTARANLPTVTIEARQELERRVDRFVAAEVFQAPDESIMRWNEPVCPSVIGLPRIFGDYVQTHILDIAHAANAPIGGQHCKANLFVVATHDPAQFLKRLWARVPRAYISRNGLPGIERVLQSPRPVRVWFNSEPHCRIDGMSGGKSADMQAFFIGGGGTQVDTSSSLFCGGGGSRLSYSSVNAIRSAVVVVDMNRMTRVTIRELADYVAMVSLADIRADADAGTAPTILRLLQDPRHSPPGMTMWDQALLYSIYNTRQASVLQMSDMEDTVAARIERRSDPGDTSSSSTSLRSPPWANEVIPRPGTNVIDWYRGAAERGDADAQNILGWAYLEGRGIPRDYGKAAQWLGKAAEQGNAAAEYDLGLMYARGQGLSQNYTTATEWYTKSAAQGDAKAQSSLALAYANGRGVPRSYAQAARWFRSAAEQGYADAQFDLGVMYANGGGVPRDYVEACKWWILARDDSASGDDAHTLSLDKLKASASRITAAQMARAQREAAAWLSAHRTTQ